MNLTELEKELIAIKDNWRIALVGCDLIVDPDRFIDSHLATLKNNPKNRTFKPFYDRLLAYYHIINKKM